MRAIIILIVLVFAGCNRKVTLHPTEGHVFYVPAGISLETVNNGIIITDHTGIWFSDFYVEQLWGVKIEQARE